MQWSDREVEARELNMAPPVCRNKEAKLPALETMTEMVLGIIEEMTSEDEK